MELLLIPPRDVEGLWPVAEPFIIAGCEQGEADPEKLKQQAMDGDADLWIAWSDRCEAAAVTKMMDAPKGQVCLIDAFGAENLNAVRPLLPQWAEWAKSQGCVALRIYGRMGWQRVMKDFKPMWIAMDKTL